MAPSEQGKERSAEEREAARQEREAARQERGAGGRRAKGAPEVERMQDLAPEPESTPEPDLILELEPIPEPHPILEPEAPTPKPPQPLRVAAPRESNDSQLVKDGRLASARAGRTRIGKRHGEPRRHSLATRVAALIALALLAILIWLLVSIFQPFAGSGHGRVVVRIPKGSSASAIGKVLAREGVIESSFFFDLRTFLDGSRGDLHAGRYVLKHGMSYSAAIKALSSSKSALPAVVKVVIPEGETREGIAEIAKRDGLKGDYLTASKRATNFPPSHYGAPTSTPNLEGFLFPATYELDVGAPVKDLVDDQLVAFSERFGETAERRAKALGLTSYQLLIVASMIEKEAMLPHDKPLVAAVIYNRLRLKMPIGIESTLRYGLKDYEKPLTESQLRSDSPYNTNNKLGLPPTPISNPGVETIEAAAHPAHAGYLYYVDDPDGCGDLLFSNTDAEFEANAARYDEAVAKNGGKPPTCKRK